MPALFVGEGFAVLEVQSSDILFSDLTTTNCNAEQMQPQALDSNFTNTTYALLYF